MKKNKRKKSVKKTITSCEAEMSKLSDSDILLSLQIQYSYSVSEVAFLYLKLHQLAVRRYYQNVMKSIFTSRQKRSRKGRLEAVSRKVEKELEKAEQQAKKEREKKVCILAQCFDKFLQNFVMISLETGFKDFKVRIIFVRSF